MRPVWYNYAASTMTIDDPLMEEPVIQFMLGLAAGLVVGLVMEWVIDWRAFVPSRSSPGSSRPKRKPATASMAGASIDTLSANVPDNSASKD